MIYQTENRITYNNIECVHINAPVVPMHLRMYIHLSSYLCLHNNIMYVWTYVCMYVCMHACMYARIQRDQLNINN